MIRQKLHITRHCTNDILSGRDGVKFLSGPILSGWACVAGGMGVGSVLSQREGERQRSSAGGRRMDKSVQSGMPGPTWHSRGWHCEVNGGRV